MKELVAREISKRIEAGEVVAVGTGSTVDLALKYIGERVAKERISISVVPSSYETALYCAQLGLNVLSPLYQSEINWGFDGADQVDPNLRLIKGRGGALLKEKILVSKCKKFVVIVDQSKLVEKLGQGMAVPVEIVPEALGPVRRALGALGALKITLREGSGKHGPIITEAGNLIVDVEFKEIPDQLENQIKSISGVIENGIFSSQAGEVLVSSADGVKSLLRTGKTITERLLV